MLSFVARTAAGETAGTRGDGSLIDTTRQYESDVRTLPRWYDGTREIARDSSAAVPKRVHGMVQKQILTKGDTSRRCRCVRSSGAGTLFYSMLCDASRTRIGPMDMASDLTDVHPAGIREPIPVCVRAQSDVADQHTKTRRFVAVRDRFRPGPSPSDEFRYDGYDTSTNSASRKLTRWAWWIVAASTRRAPDIARVFASVSRRGHESLPLRARLRHS